MYVKSQKIDFLTYSIQEALNMAKELWVAKVFLAEKSRVLDLEYPFGHDCDDFFCEEFYTNSEKNAQVLCSFWSGGIGKETLENAWSKTIFVNDTHSWSNQYIIVGTLFEKVDYEKSDFNDYDDYYVWEKPLNYILTEEEEDAILDFFDCLITFDQPIIL